MFFSAVLRLLLNSERLLWAKWSTVGLRDQLLTTLRQCCFMVNFLTDVMVLTNQGWLSYCELVDLFEHLFLFQFAIKTIVFDITMDFAHQYCIWHFCSISPPKNFRLWSWSKKSSPWSLISKTWNTSKISKLIAALWLSRSIIYQRKKQINSWWSGTFSAARNVRWGFAERFYFCNCGGKNSLHLLVTQSD